MQQEGNKKMKTTSLSENSVTKSIKKFTSSYGIVVVMLLMIVVCSIISPNFLTKNNVLNVLCQSAVYAMLACAEGVLIISGLIDLSAGSTVCMAGILAIPVYVATGSHVVALLAAIASGIVMNAITGVFVSALKLPAFVATLAMQMAVRGAAKVYTGGMVVTETGEGFSFVGQGYIGGCKGTACTLTDELYGVPAGGTMAHSWVQMFDSEYEAFKAYCEIYPDNPTLLVDTYNVLKSGVPNAIRVFNEVLKPRGLTKCGIRLDSGDMTYLTKKTRKMLDEAGWESCKISCSNALDEYLIQDLLNQGAQIDLFGVGERLITARSEPVFGCVYKLAAVEDEAGNIIPKIKVSENVGKITNPHFKKVYRFYGNDTGKAIADYICLHDEVVDDSRDLEIFDPQATWKRKNIYNFTAKELLVPIFQNGELVYNMPSLPEIQKYCAEQVDTLWDEVQRFDIPHTYYVDLSQKLWDIKYALLKSNRR